MGWVSKTWVLLWILLPPIIFAQDLEPKKSRAKIDAVKIKDAPDIRIFSTFLDLTGLPVKPEALSSIDVYCSGKPIDESFDIKAFEDKDEESVDLAFVVPLSKRFTEEESAQIQDFLKTSFSLMGENDRAALFIDDGRGIVTTPLIPPADAEKALDAIVPHANGAFLYSGLDRAIQTLNKDPIPGRKRAVIVFTDGYDSTILYPVEIFDHLGEIIEFSREKPDPEMGGIVIYVVMYHPLRDGLPPLFEALSRKTKGTYREVISASDIARRLKMAFGEIYGQLVIDFTMSDAKEGMECAFSIRYRRREGSDAHTPDFAKVKFGKVGLTLFWKIFWIVVAILLMILLIVLIKKGIKKFKEKRAAKAEADEEEVKAAPEEVEEKAEEMEEKVPAQPKLPPPRRVR